MRKVIELAKRFRKEEDGAAMVEYTVLLGIITIAVIASIVVVGTWVGARWTALSTVLTANP